jgi:uncharacterized damage-inducible protein DinB
MAVSADTLRLQLDYSAWASQRLLDATGKLTPEELTRDFKTADKNVLETLVHVFAADRIWLARVQGETRATFVEARDRDLAVLRKEWPALQQSWKQYVAPLSDEGAIKVVAYKDMKGNSYQQPLWQILLHLVNHGTHQRAGLGISTRHGVHTGAVGSDRVLPASVTHQHRARVRWSNGNFAAERPSCGCGENLAAGAEIHSRRGRGQRLCDRSRSGGCRCNEPRSRLFFCCKRTAPRRPSATFSRESELSLTIGLLVDTARARCTFWNRSAGRVTLFGQVLREGTDRHSSLTSMSMWKCSKASRHRGRSWK